MFSSAKKKLEDSRVILERLRLVNDALSFRALFNSFLSASRAITYALQKDGKHIIRFNDWYEEKRQEMKDDELLRFIHKARTANFHRGKHKLHFTTVIQHFSTATAEPPPSPNAKIAIGGEGAFWIADEGTSRERRIPIKQGGSYVTQVSIAGAPTVHRGKKLEKNDPVTICQLALDYFSKLIHEAKIKFAP